MSKAISIITGICIIFFPVLYRISGDIFANEITSCIFVFFLLLVAVIRFLYGIFKKYTGIISMNMADIVLAIFVLYFFIYMLVHREWVTGQDIIYKWSIVILCYLFFRNYSYSRITLLIACCISGIVQAVIAVFQKTGLLSSHNLTFDITGTFNNPGPLGGYIAICSIITIGLLYYSIKNKRNIAFFFLSIGLSIQFYALYLTGSRSAILSLLTGCIFFVFNSILVKKTAWKYKKQLMIIAGLMLIIGGALMYQLRPASADGRLLIWRVSADMITDAPFLGHGIHGFSKEYMLYQANYFRENPTSHFIPIADNVVYVFNEFIYIWIQYGIIGLLLAISFLYFIFTNTRTSAENNHIKAGLLALLTFSFFSYPFAVLPLLLFYPLLCGSMVGGKIYYKFRMTFLKQAFMIFLIVIAMIKTYKDILFLKNIFGSLLALYEKDGYDIDNIDYKKIKDNINFNDYYATWLTRQSKTENQRIKDMYPSCETYCLLGNYYIEQKDYKLAEYYFQKASFMIPTRLRPKYSLWELYKDTGQPEKAKEMANVILIMKLKIESTYTLRMKRRVRDYYK